VVKFMIHKYFSTNVMVLRRTLRTSYDRSLNCNSQVFYTQKGNEEMFFEEQKRVVGFFFNHLVDGVVCKLIGVEGQSLRWTNGKRLDESDIV
jgi:hypothetical protein